MMDECVILSLWIRINVLISWTLYFEATLLNIFLIYYYFHIHFLCICICICMASVFLNGCHEPEANLRQQKLKFINEERRSLWKRYAVAEPKILHQTQKV